MHKTAPFKIRPMSSINTKLFYSISLTFLSLCLFGQFGPQEYIFPNSQLPTSIQTGDIDNDGDIDVAVAFAEQSRIVWYSNINETGSFENENIVTKSIDIPESIVLSDLDGDGDLDIVSASSGDNTIAWYENTDGLGTFGEMTKISTNSSSAEFAIVSDVDNDGDMDVLSASSGNDKVVWYQNTDGLGQFADEIIITQNAKGVQSIFSADINNDGHSDLLVASTLSGKASWFENINGTGVFGIEHTISTDQIGLQSITAADYDNDGDIDVAISVYEEFQLEKIVWFENMDALGDFSEEIMIKDYYDGALDLLSADLNGDGFIDLISSSTDHYAYWLENNGDGTFSTNVMGNIRNYSVAVGDLNGDEITDLIVGFKEGINLKWFENQGDNVNFHEKILAETPESVRGITVGDYNNDGIMDFATSSGSWENYMIWHEGGDSEITASHVIGDAGPFAPELDDNLTSIDFDSDGDLDIFFGGEEGLGWFENLDGAGLFTNEKILPTTNDYSIVGLHVDIDNDGDLDIVTRTGSSGNVGWLENLNGFGEYGAFISIEEGVYGQLNCIRSGDFNGDGFNDIIVGSHTGEMIWYKNQGGSGFELGEVFLTGVKFYRDFELVDLDGDNDLDIAAFDNDNPSSVVIKWYENLDGQGNCSEGDILVEMGGAGRHVLASDIDLDGDNDLIAVTGGHIYFIENLNEQGLFADPHLISLNYSNIKDVVLEDIDNDGDDDIIVTSSGDDKVTFHRNYYSSKRIKAVTFNDVNENGQYDQDELTLLNQSVQIDPAALVSWTNGHGELYYIASKNEYKLTARTEEKWENSTENKALIDFTESTFDTTVYFGFIPKYDIYETEVLMNSAPTRCGFRVPFWITNSNTGTKIFDSTIELEIDPLCKFVSATPLPDSIDNNTYYWFNDNFFPTYSDQISLVIEMPGVEFLGEDISFTSRSYAFDENQNIMDSDTFIYKSRINCGYDPNDKLVDIPIPNQNNYTFFEDSLVYTIRFQNTGTDTAINIQIIDDLDMNLDFSSFKVLAASHDYTATLNDNGRATFNFENIYLPNSMVNEVASHGFITYRVNPKDSLTEGTVISNFAGIYFDFNPPIITNTTSNILVYEFPLDFEIGTLACFDSENGTISLQDPENGFSYTWNDGTIGPDLSDLQSGEYTITVKADNGKIVADSTVFLTAPDELIVSEFTTTPETENDQNGTAKVEITGGTPPYSYAWDTDPIQNDSIAINLTGNTYNVTVTDDNGCAIIETIIVEKLVNTSEINIHYGFDVVPNPSFGNVDVIFKVQDKANWQLKVYNINGLVFREFDSKSTPLHNGRFNIQNLNSGFYHFVLFTETGMYNQKVVVVE